MNISANSQMGPTKTNREISGWINELYADAGLDTVMRNPRILDYVMPTWLLCDVNGGYTEKRNDISAQLLEYCAENNIGIMPLIAGEPDHVAEMLRDPDLSRKHIASLLDLAVENKWLGLDIDYEFLPGELCKSYTNFIRDLAGAFHRHDLLISVDLHPKTRPDDPWSVGARAQDWRALSLEADILRVMCYDQHHPAYVFGEPGPISSRIWAEAVMTYAVSVIPRSKLVMGVPFYGCDWDTADPENTKHLYFQEVMAVAAKHEAVIEIDPLSNVPHFTYQDSNDHRHEVWFENNESLGRKLDIVNQFDLRGMSAWVFNLEDHKNWGVIGKKFGAVC